MSGKDHAWRWQPSYNTRDRTIHSWHPIFRLCLQAHQSKEEGKTNLDCNMKLLPEKVLRKGTREIFRPLQYFIISFESIWEMPKLQWGSTNKSLVFSASKNLTIRHVWMEEQKKKIVSERHKLITPLVSSVNFPFSSSRIAFRGVARFCV